MAVWWGSLVECCSAFARLQRSGMISEEERYQMLTPLYLLQESWHEILPGNELRIMATRLLGLHDLRAADALQLAAALQLADQQARLYGFVCLDRKLRQAARREGFSLLPTSFPQ